MVDRKRILLIVSGGIAAYKSLELIRLVKDSGVSVVPVMTESAGAFVTPLSLSVLSGNKVRMSLHDSESEMSFGHIELSRQTDLVVVAPATANLLSKAAHGIADDLASNILLATDKTVLMAPAMNVKMWQHAATTRNINQLVADGIKFIGPNVGEMACGEFGPGRMAEPIEIFNAVKNEIAIGYRLEEFKTISSNIHNDKEMSYGIVINPYKSKYIQFQKKDLIIVLSEN